MGQMTLAPVKTLLKEFHKHISTGLSMIHTNSGGSSSLNFYIIDDNSSGVHSCIKYSISSSC